MTIIDSVTPAEQLAGVFSISLIKNKADLATEQWKLHPDHVIWVSNLGRVKSLRGNIVGTTKMRSSKACHGVRPDYVRVTTSSCGFRINKYVHVLVLETWVGPRPEGHDGDHINQDMFDNRLVNLRWRPAAENRANK